MATYQLPTIETPEGTLRITLFSFTAYTVPNPVGLTNISEIVERVNVEPGFIELEDVTFEYEDVHTDYADGFWHNFLSDDEPEILLELDEGGTYQSIFRGYVTDTAPVAEETSVIGSVVTRRGQFTCTSMMAKLKNTSVDDSVGGSSWLSTLRVTHSVIGRSSFRTFCPLVNALAAIIEKGFGVTYTLADCVVASNTAWRFRGESVDDASETSNLTWDQLWLDTTVDTEHWLGQLDTSTTLYSALTQICKGLGLVARYKYNSSLGRHTIEFYESGYPRANAVTFDPESPIRSQLHVQSPSMLKGGVVISANKPFWPAPYQNLLWIDEAGAYGEGPEMPISLEADLMIETQFGNYDAVYPGQYDDLWWIDTGSTPAYEEYHIDEFEFAYNLTPTYTSTSGEDWPQGEALARYYYERFGDGIEAPQSFQEYVRAYNTIKATESSTNSVRYMQPFMKHVIAGPEGTKTYIATEVRKDIMASTTQVRWMETK